MSADLPAEQLRVKQGSTDAKLASQREATFARRSSLIPDLELMENPGLYLRTQKLARLLFIDQLYRIILDARGVVMEFGVR